MSKPKKTAKTSSIVWDRADTTVPGVTPLATNPPPGFAIDVASILAGTLRAELGLNDGRLSVTTAACITIPGDISAGKYIKSWSCDVRGFISKPKNARAVAIVLLGGTTKEIEFPWGKQIVGTASSFTVTFTAKETKLPVMVPLHLSVMVVVQRQNASDEVLLQVESFDVEARVS